MKAYGIFPAFDLNDPTDVRVQSCLSHIVSMVCDLLRRDGDHFHVTVDWRDPGTAAFSICTEGLAKPHILDLSDEKELRALVQMSIDPFSGKSAWVIRSMATCRAVMFGYDGQAFICLRHEDLEPVSTDPSLVVVESMPSLLTETDLFDGGIVSPSK